ncbi:hypothetical protein WPG_0947 [Winogradskyella sp. PG-2]|nr:hypothetical protein WPG_0947 [Winogradskyella sp. PG-2]
MMLSAQQNVTYNGKTFKPAEVIETQIGNSGETLSFTISEIDMSPNGDWAKKISELQRQGKTYNPKDAPRPLYLSLSVDFKRRFKFPIAEEDSVSINVSYVKESMLENEFNEEEVNKMNSAVSKTDISGLKSDKKSVEEEVKKISKLMQEGKLSPDEAMKKIEALTQPMLNTLENSVIMNQETEEFKENRSTYNILFGDSAGNTESIPYKGTLHIIEFNSKRLRAYFKGTHFVECTDVARANDKSKPCEKVETGLFPNHKVFRVEDISITIDTNFKTFYDNR